MGTDDNDETDIEQAQKALQDSKHMGVKLNFRRRLI
jgi:hypothetical protein